MATVRVHRPLLVALLAAAGLVMIFTGILVPHAQKENPSTALVVGGFFVLFSVFPVATGECRGTERAEVCAESAGARSELETDLADHADV